MAYPVKFQIVLIAAFAAASMIVAPSAAREKKHHRRTLAAARADPSRSSPADAQPSQPSLDDLYRRRGYGIGGPVFGADTALAGSCADLRFAQPSSCGRGYGIYGNGLGSQFGR